MKSERQVEAEILTEKLKNGTATNQDHLDAVAHIAESAARVLMEFADGLREGNNMSIPKSMQEFILELPTVDDGGKDAPIEKHSPHH